MIKYMKFNIDMGEELYYILSKNNQVQTAKNIANTNRVFNYSDKNLKTILTIEQQKQFIKSAMEEIKPSYIESVIEVIPKDKPRKERYQLILTKDYTEFLDDEEIQQFSKCLQRR